MPARHPQGHEDARRAWDLMGGAPGFGSGFTAWADAHPRRIAVLGILAVLLVILTAIGFAVWVAGGFSSPVPAATRPAALSSSAAPGTW